MVTGVRRRGALLPASVTPLLAVVVAIWLPGAPLWYAMERMVRFGLDPAEALVGVALPLALGGLALPALLGAAGGRHWAAPVLWSLVALVLLAVAVWPAAWPAQPPWPLVMMPLAVVAMACHRQRAGPDPSP